VTAVGPEERRPALLERIAERDKPSAHVTLSPSLVARRTTAHPGDDLLDR
jgi:hypothetical protein